MRTCRLLQLLASFAAPSGLHSFSCHRRRTLEPSVRLGSLPASVSDGNFEEREDAPVRRRDGAVGSRRSLLHSAGLSVAGTVSSGPLACLLHVLLAEDYDVVTNERLGRYGRVGAARAMGLVHFPCPPGALSNTYHLMRAGQSGLEAEGVLSTNPLFLTNREDGLTDLGHVQVEVACNAMMSNGVNPSVVKYSLAAKCIDAANVVATKMMVGRNRLIPEFTYMDPRGAGAWDGRPVASAEAALWALDATEAGNEGRDGRPPANEDGTANETLFDQFIRLRQLMSVLETQYSGDSILLIFPDGTGPALLSCLIAGIPLKHTHALNFMPGECRMGVDMNNAKELLSERISSPLYTETMAKGQEELAALRREEEQLKLLAMEEESRRAAAAKSRRIKSAAPDESSKMERHRHRARGSRQIESAPDASSKTEGRRRPAGGDDAAAGFNPDYVSAAAIGAAGYMTTRGAGDEDDASDEAENAPLVTPAPSLDSAAAVGATARVATRRAGDEEDASVGAAPAPRVVAAVPSPDPADANGTAPALPARADADATAGAAIATGGGDDAPEDPCLDALDARAGEFAALPEVADAVRGAARTMAVPANVFDASTGTVDPNVFEDVPLVPERERVRAAEEAMEDYLSQDDGGDDWLSAMKGLMEE